MIRRGESPAGAVPKQRSPRPANWDAITAPMRRFRTLKKRLASQKTANSRRISADGNKGPLTRIACEHALATRAQARHVALQAARDGAHVRYLPGAITKNIRTTSRLLTRCPAILLSVRTYCPSLADKEDASKQSYSRVCHAYIPCRCRQRSFHSVNFSNR